MGVVMWQTVLTYRLLPSKSGKRSRSWFFHPLFNQKLLKRELHVVHPTQKYQLFSSIFLLVTLCFSFFSSLYFFLCTCKLIEVLLSTKTKLQVEHKFLPLSLSLYLSVSLWEQPKNSLKVQEGALQCTTATMKHSECAKSDIPSPPHNPKDF